jgi:hypothetical protein
VQSAKHPLLQGLDQALGERLLLAARHNQRHRHSAVPTEPQPSTCGVEAHRHDLQDQDIERLLERLREVSVPIVIGVNALGGRLGARRHSCSFYWLGRYLCSAEHVSARPASSECHTVKHCSEKGLYRSVVSVVRPVIGRVFAPRRLASRDWRAVHTQQSTQLAGPLRIRYPRCHRSRYPGCYLQRGCWWCRFGDRSSRYFRCFRWSLIWRDSLSR